MLARGSRLPRFLLTASSVVWALLGPALAQGQSAGSDRQAEAGRRDARPQTSSLLSGAWVQDDAGPVLTYRKRYHFRPDGSYEFLFTSRNTGSSKQTVLSREAGSFTVDTNRLTLFARTGPPRSFPWRIERDPYVGDTRLVMVLPSGTLDIYYRE